MVIFSTRKSKGHYHGALAITNKCQLQACLQHANISLICLLFLRQLGTSPLHFASQFGHLSTAEVLLRAGISRDARTKVDRTPLHVASQEGHLEIVDLLIRNGADIEAKDMVPYFFNLIYLLINLFNKKHK